MLVTLKALASLLLVPFLQYTVNHQVTRSAIVCLSELSRGPSDHSTGFFTSRWQEQENTRNLWLKSWLFVHRYKGEYIRNVCTVFWLLKLSQTYSRPFSSLAVRHRVPHSRKTIKSQWFKALTAEWTLFPGFGAFARCSRRVYRRRFGTHCVSHPHWSYKQECSPLVWLFLFIWPVTMKPTISSETSSMNSLRISCKNRKTWKQAKLQSFAI